MIDLEKHKIKKILIVRLRFIGDIVLSTPLIRALKEQYPKIKISYLAEEGMTDILKGSPHIDELIVCKKNNFWEEIKTLKKVRKKRFDMVIDVFCNPRSALITYFSGARFRLGWNLRGRNYAYNIKIKGVKKKKNALDVYQEIFNTIKTGKISRDTEVFLSKKEKGFAASFFREKRISNRRKTVGIHPGASWPAKMWDKRKFARLAQRFQKAGASVILFGGPKEKGLLAEIVKLMKKKPVVAQGLDLKSLAAVIARCDVFISNDNGPMHIAPAVNVPTVGIFGPSEPDIWFPYDRKKNAYIKSKVKCWPCKKDLCDDLKCMNNIKVNDVYKQAIKIWK